MKIRNKKVKNLQRPSNLKRIKFLHLSIFMTNVLPAIGRDIFVVLQLDTFTKSPYIVERNMNLTFM